MTKSSPRRIARKLAGADGQNGTKSNVVLGYRALEPRMVFDGAFAATADAAADTSRMRHAWSGSAFVFALPSNPPHQTEAQAVGIVAATCGNEKP